MSEIKRRDIIDLMETISTRRPKNAGHNNNSPEDIRISCPNCGNRDNHILKTIIAYGNDDYRNAKCVYVDSRNTVTKKYLGTVSDCRSRYGDPNVYIILYCEFCPYEWVYEFLSHKGGVYKAEFLLNKREIEEQKI